MTREPPAPKEAHTGTAAHPFGPLVYLIHDYTGKMVNIEATRHDAVGWIANLGRRSRSVKPSWFEITPLRVGAVPLSDLALTELPGRDGRRAWRRATGEIPA